MLGSFATKLRILGFDTVYDKTSDDLKLLQHAAKEGRQLVTSDVELFLLARSKHLKATLISSRDELGRLVELYMSLGMNRVREPKMSRCSVCNGILISTNEKTEQGETMHICESCGKKYWRGSHWEKLQSLFDDANMKLKIKRHLELGKKGRHL